LSGILLYAIDEMDDRCVDASRLLPDHVSIVSDAQPEGYCAFKEVTNADLLLSGLSPYRVQHLFIYVNGRALSESLLLTLILFRQPNLNNVA